MDLKVAIQALQRLPFRMRAIIGRYLICEVSRAAATVDAYGESRRPCVKKALLDPNGSLCTGAGIRFGINDRCGSDWQTRMHICLPTNTTRMRVQRGDKESIP